MIFIILFIVGILTITESKETSTYTTKYDDIDLDEILTNDRLLDGYINCLLDLGPCTPDGKELKNNLPDAMKNDCKKCTERQREGADEVMHFIIDHRPEDWTKLEIKYKDNGDYKKKYLETKEASNQSHENDSEEDTKRSHDKTQ